MTLDAITGVMCTYSWDLGVASSDLSTIRSVDLTHIICSRRVADNENILEISLKLGEGRIQS